MKLVRRLLRAATASPVRIAATAAAITPGMHLLISTTVERRRPRWSTEYPAVTVGDPLLAVCAGIATHVAGAGTVARSAPLRAPLGPVIAGTAALFGAWQLQDELRRGVYTKGQAFSPSKLWHQFVVYPTLCPLVSGALVSATAAAVAPGATRRQRVGTTMAWAGVAGWAALVLHAVAHPHQGHGEFDWSRLRPGPDRGAGPADPGSP